MILISVQVLVSALALASVWVAGNRESPWLWVAWPLLIAGHTVFLLYSWYTGQWGFWPLNAGMVAIGIRNWRRSEAKPISPDELVIIVEPCSAYAGLCRCARCTGGLVAPLADFRLDQDGTIHAQSDRARQLLPGVLARKARGQERDEVPK